MNWDNVLILAVGLLLLLAGCTSAPKVPDVVHVPIPTPCLARADIPARPAIAPDRELARLDDYDLVRTIAAERAELVAWSGQALALLERCARP